MELPDLEEDATEGAEGLESVPEAEVRVQKSTSRFAAYRNCLNAALPPLAAEFGLTPYRFACNASQECSTHEVQQCLQEPQELARKFICSYVPLDTAMPMPQEGFYRPPGLGCCSVLP